MLVIKNLINDDKQGVGRDRVRAGGKCDLMGYRVFTGDWGRKGRRWLLAVLCALTMNGMLIGRAGAFAFSQVDSYWAQYHDLLAYVNELGLAHRAMQVELADYPKTSQYTNAIVRKYGYNACGLVAAAILYDNSLSVMDWIRQAAATAYRNDAGIQPTPYTEALRAVFGEENVKAQDRWTLGEMYQALSQGDLVIVDIQVREGVEVPSTNRSNYSHFVRVLGLDLDRERIYLENTLRGSAYWDISLREFWETWKFPETAVSNRYWGAEAVTRWAVLIHQAAVPHPPSRVTGHAIRLNG